MEIKIKDEYVRGEFLILCDLQKNCKECPFHEMKYCHEYPDEHPEETKSIIINWYETHPEEKEHYLNHKARLTKEEEDENKEEDSYDRS